MVIDAGCAGIALDDELVRLVHIVGVDVVHDLRGLDGGLFGVVLGGLRVDGLVELDGGRLGLNVHLRQVLLPSVQNLQHQHGVVVADVEGQHDVDEEGQHVLDGDLGVAAADLHSVDLGHHKHELNHNQSGEVDDPAGVVVEEEEFGVVQDFSALH